MTTDTGWPGGPGVPLNPERDGWHWLRDNNPGEIVAALWNGPDCTHWSNVWDFAGNDEGLGPESVARYYAYVAPCILPAELAAAEAAAAREAVEACAKWHDDRAAARHYAGFIGDAAVHEVYAEAIRALPPRPSGALDRMIAEAEKRGYKKGWDDREGDLLNSIDRVYGAKASRDE